ncbi:Uncaracterized surface protein containing fasciclin (FAS1) repeats [Algoriphagus faecimaris]|uniref:Uncaracterized surface protein containing fasciclin (FAS1) repeats n=1 Tax=Algoriphagus faecimaris TaxID=686796 RepID=A0A1G6WRC3_9BACT|nr:fasciclin domain-containing protein [Algoriphagus faecimaris]SDD68500.1 Uncaracterized surface protein containing fasciclin (FAS1) repeats [Algoriphagus faecimaris]
MTNSINQFIKGGLGLLFLVFMAACSQIEDQAIPAQNDLKLIPEVLKTMETEGDVNNSNARKSAGRTFATFNAALGKSGLASVFSRNDLTVFAPTDAAFAELGLNPGNIGDLEGLTSILLYHVVAGSVFSTDLVEGFVPTLNGAGVEISLMNGPKVNESNIILVDKQARNGVIHGIDAVLLPPSDNIMELVNNNENFTILKAAIEAAEIENIVANTPNITVFAPTDQAFIDLLNSLPEVDTLEDLVAFLGGTDGLISVLAYHVFADGRVFSSDLTDIEITMFSGDKVTIDTSGPKLIDLGGGESNIIDTDIQGNNGVVHVIDRVLLNL